MLQETTPDLFRRVSH